MGLPWVHGCIGLDHILVMMVSGDFWSLHMADDNLGTSSIAFVMTWLSEFRLGLYLVVLSKACLP